MATNARINITAKDRTRGAIGSATAGLKRLNSAVFSAQSAIAGLAGAAGLGALVARSLKAGDALGKTADKLGVTTEALAGMRLAAEKTAGVTSNVLDTAVQRLSRRASEAAQGTGTLAKELKLLNIDAQRFATLSADEQFLELGRAMKSVTNQGDRLRISMAAFDTEGAVLEATLDAMTDSANDFNKEALEMGLALSRVDAAKLETAGDALDDMGRAVQGIGNQITVAMAPALTAAANAMTGLAKETEFWGALTVKAVDVAVKGFFAIAKSANAASFVFKNFELITGEVFSKLFSWLETWYGLLAQGADFVGLDTIAAGLTTMSEAMETLALSTESNLLKVQEKLFEHVEIANALDAARIASIEAVAESGELAAEREITALRSVEKAKASINAGHAKLDKIAAKETLKAEQQKEKALQRGLASSMAINSALLNDNKAVKAGLIVADTAAGIMQAMSEPGVPFPIKIANAAATAAMGVAQLASARSASKGGGSVNAGGGGGGFAAEAPSPVLQDQATAAGPSTSVSVSLTGGLYSKDDIRELIRNINQEVGDGMELLAS